MRNTLKNHIKVHGPDLGHISWNAGLSPDEVPTDFVQILKSNLSYHITKGSVVSIIWPSGSFCGLVVDSVNGSFVTLNWPGTWREFSVTGIPYKYSYGRIVCHKSFVSQGD